MAHGVTRRSLLKGSAALAGAAALSSMFDGPLSSLQEGLADEAVVEDKWVTSVCRQCRVFCPIRVHVVNGVAVKIEGNPDDPNARGRICGKSQAGLMTLYNPYRVKAPMIRTNPEKGIEVDPEWLELSWDEALDILAEKMKPVLEEDAASFDVYTSNFTDEYAKNSIRNLVKSFGVASSAGASGGAIGWQDGICGDGAHRATLRHLGGFVDSTDYDYCEYAMFFGTNYFGAGKGWPTPMRSFLKNRERGMKVVVIDPVQSDFARMADEWVPIKPGTDQAFCLGMMHSMVFETGLYDPEVIEHRTNSPYLIGPDGMYVRSEEDLVEDQWRLNLTMGKPLVWDAVDNCTKTFDDPTVKQFALEGTYTVNGVECRPAWELFLEFLKPYTPEWAEEICTIPAADIRRIAKEFGEAAHIGETMTFNDDPEGPYEVPYTPVSVVCHKGAQAHYHCMLICRAAYMLTTLVGAANVVGSVRGSEGVTVNPKPGVDGVITEGIEFSNYAFNYPPSKSKDIFFFGPETRDMDVLVNPEEHPEEAALYGDKLHKRMMYHQFRNPIKSRGTGKQVVEGLKTVDFIWTIPLVHDEMTAMADLLLPEGSYLERMAMVTPGTRALKGSYWEFDEMMQGQIKDFEALQQPTVEPVYNTRHILDIMTEVCDRMGHLAEWNAAVTKSMSISDEYALDPNTKYTTRELLDAHAKSKFGAEYGIEYFETVGFKGKPAESRKDWYGYLKNPGTRFPVYDEWWVWAREQYKADREAYGLRPHTEAYADLIPFPEWHGIGNLDEAPAEFDLCACHSGDTLRAMCTPMEDPWRGDYMERFASSVLGIKMHTSAAEARGLKTGDHVIVESQYGNKVEADVYVTECIRPDCIGFSGAGPCRTVHSGPYAKIGTHFNSLISDYSEAHDQVTGNADFSAMVKVYKA